MHHDAASIPSALPLARCQADDRPHDPQRHLPSPVCDYPVHWLCTHLPHQHPRHDAAGPVAPAHLVETVTGSAFGYPLLIDTITTGIPTGRFRVLGHTLHRRRDDILAFFDHPASNGPTEGSTASSNTSEAPPEASKHGQQHRPLPTRRRRVRDPQSTAFCEEPDRRPRRRPWWTCRAARRGSRVQACCVGVEESWVMPCTVRDRRVTTPNRTARCAPSRPVRSLARSSRPTAKTHSGEGSRVGIRDCPRTRPLGSRSAPRLGQLATSSIKSRCHRPVTVASPGRTGDAYNEGRDRLAIRCRLVKKSLPGLCECDSRLPGRTNQGLRATTLGQLTGTVACTVATRPDGPRYPAPYPSRAGVAHAQRTDRGLSAGRDRGPVER